MIPKQKHLIKNLSVHKLFFSLAILPLFMLFQQEALAIANSPVQVVVGVIRKHDDNLFRQDKNTQSDNITGLSAGLKLDKKLGLQQITAEATITKNKYSENDQLDFTSKNYEATLHWSLTRKLTGKLSVDRKQRLNNFDDTQNELRNIRTLENQIFLADFNPTGGWHLLGGVSRQTLDNSETFNQDASYSANATDFGVKYIYPSGTSMKAMNHIRRGKYEDRETVQARLFDDGYKEYETEAELDWLLTVKSRVLLNVSYIKRDHDNFSARDYSGLQSKLGYDWKPTEKINISVTAQSKLNTYQTDVDSYTRNNQLKLTPKYALTPKINFKGDLALSERKFLGSGYNTPTANSRVDKLKVAGLGVEWKPTLESSVELSLSHYDQNSNNDQFDYKGNIASVSGSIFF